MPHDLWAYCVRVISCMQFFEYRHYNSTSAKFAGEMRAQNTGGFFARDPCDLRRILRYFCETSGTNFGHKTASTLPTLPQNPPKKTGAFWGENRRFLDRKMMKKNRKSGSFLPCFIDVFFTNIGECATAYL